MSSKEHVTTPVVGMSRDLIAARRGTADDVARSAHAVPARTRVIGVDVARAVALFGMMVIHLLPSHNFDGSSSLVYELAGGRAAATFAVLAGVGLALSTSRLSRRSSAGWRAARAGLVVRGLAIGSIGLALGAVDSGVAVILAYYGLLFVLAVPLLRASPGLLAAVAVLAATIVPVVSHVLRSERFPPFDADNATFSGLADDPAELLVELTVTGYYPALAWLTYLCAGLAVGRLDLRSRRVAGGLLGGGVALAVLGAAGSWLVLGPLGGENRIAAANGLEPRSAAAARLVADERYGTTPTATWWWLGIDAPHSSTPFDLLHTTGIAIAVLGAALLLTRVLRAAWLPLAAAGSMTLTLYTGHVLLRSTEWLLDDPVHAYWVHALAAVGVALLFRAAGRRGPLEDVVATLANRARQAAGPTRADHRRGSGQI